jgi:hypothetical protein
VLLHQTPANVVRQSRQRQRRQRGRDAALVAPGEVEEQPGPWNMITSTTRSGRPPADGRRGLTDGSPVTATLIGQTG